MKPNLKIILVMKNLVFTVAAIACLINGCSSPNKENKMETVTSKDGTKIAFKKSGDGHALILITGALASHSDYEKLAQLLSTDFTVYTYDRLGRGQSGNIKPYSAFREVEDLHALLDDAGGAAFLFGASSGACLALETAAALGNKVKKLAIYEPPYDEAAGASEKWEEYSREINKFIAADQRADAVEYHMKFVGVPDAALVAMKATPRWQSMKELAHTIAYDIKVVGDKRSIPVDKFAKIEMNTLVMDGGESLGPMPFMRVSADKLAATIPNAQRRTIEGESHNVSDKVLGPILKKFYSE